MAAGGEVGGRVGAAASDGYEVVEGPIAWAKFAATVKTTAPIAAENLPAKGDAAEAVGAGPSAGLAVGVAFRLIRHERKLLLRGGALELGGDFVRETNFQQAAARPMIEKANAALAGQFAKYVPCGECRKAGNTRGLASGEAHGAASGEIGAAHEMVVERALVGGEA